jgi:hypothetical protein
MKNPVKSANAGSTRLNASVSATKKGLFGGASGKLNSGLTAQRVIPAASEEDAAFLFYAGEAGKIVIVWLPGIRVSKSKKSTLKA